MWDDRDDEFYITFFLKYRFYSAVHANMGGNEGTILKQLHLFHPRGIKDQITVYLQCRMREKVERQLHEFSNEWSNSVSLEVRGIKHALSQQQVSPFMPDVVKMHLTSSG